MDSQQKPWWEELWLNNSKEWIKVSGRESIGIGDDMTWCSIILYAFFSLILPLNTQSYLLILSWYYNPFLSRRCFFPFHSSLHFPSLHSYNYLRTRSGPRSWSTNASDANADASSTIPTKSQVLTLHSLFAPLSLYFSLFLSLSSCHSLFSTFTLPINLQALHHKITYIYTFIHTYIPSICLWCNSSWSSACLALYFSWTIFKKPPPTFFTTPLAYPQIWHCVDRLHLDKNK